MWAAITAIATGATTAVVITAAIFTYRQVREASRARKLEGALAVLTYISSPKLRRVRRLIYTHAAEINAATDPNPSWEELDAFFKRLSNGDVSFAIFHSYLAALENVSILVMHDLAPDDIVEMYFARIAPQHWRDLSRFIAFMRKRYASDDFLQHFEMLNELMKDGGLNTDRGAWTGLFTLLKSTRMKRRLLNDRRRELKATLQSITKVEP
jgi:hypothetical protein